MATRSKRPAMRRAGKAPAGRKTDATTPAPRFFATQAAWRRWLAENHAKRTELWVGFWRVATGKACITWPQSVDEALCFGWIDGLRRGLDAEGYMIRFSPRGSGSKWSRVNLKRFAELSAQGKVTAAGRAARAKWDDAKSAGYSYEARHAELDARSLAALKASPRAWRFWEAQIPSYRKLTGHWVTSAKREETRASRFALLLRSCERWEAIPQLAKLVKVKRPEK